MIPLRDNLKVHKSSIVVWTLVAINLLVFGREMFSESTRFFIQKWGLVPADISLLEPLSLISFFTAIFLHGGFVHLLGNMWFLGIFGQAVEAAFGHLKFLFLYIFWGVVAFLAQYVLIPAAQVPMIGASGAIAGVLGSYLVFYSKARVLTLIPIFIVLTTAWVPAFVFIPYWFLIQVFSGTAQIARGVGAEAGVAFWAHVGGFIAGYLTARYYKDRINKSKRYQY